MADLKDIFELEGENKAESLMKYLQGNASDEERFAIEKLMTEDPFVNDAIEGLQNFKNPHQAQDYVNQLNSQLQKLANKKQLRKKKRKILEQNWLIISILTILLLCVAGYLLIHFFSNPHPF